MLESPVPTSHPSRAYPLLKVGSYFLFILVTLLHAKQAHCSSLPHFLPFCLPTFLPFPFSIYLVILQPITICFVGIFGCILLSCCIE